MKLKIFNVITLLLIFSICLNIKVELDECPCKKHPTTTSTKLKNVKTLNKKKTPRVLRKVNTLKLARRNKNFEPLANVMSGMMLIGKSLYKHNSTPEGFNFSRNLQQKASPFDNIGLFDIITGRVDPRKILMGEKDKVLSFIRKNKYQISKDISFDTVMEYVKRYMKEEYNMDSSKIDQVSPMIKSYFPSILKEALEEPGIKELTNQAKPNGRKLIKKKAKKTII